MNISLGKARWIAYPAIIALYVACGWLSFGYDDEYFNIDIITRMGFDAVAWTQTTDVHPPGSYLVNLALHALLGDWSLVRVAIAGFAALCICWLIESVHRTSGSVAALVAVVLIGLNPSILMWCAGLRWYAILLPLACLALAPPRPGGWLAWGWVFALLLAMAFVGYAAVVLAPAILWLQWQRDPAPAREKIIRALVLSLVCGAAYAWQASIFLTVHSAGAAGQAGSLFKALQGAAIAQFGNQGLFPLSVPAAIGAIGTGLLGLAGLLAALKTRVLPRATLAWALVVAAMLVTGLGGKMRNYVLADPLKGLALTELFMIAGPARWLPRAALAMVALANVWGMFNVVTHRDTTKQSWNLPIAATLSKVRAASAQCGGATPILTHEPVLTYWLAQEGARVIGPYAGSEEAASGQLANLPAGGTIPCVIVIKSYAGSFKDDRIGAMYDLADGLAARGRARSFVGRDDFYKVKQMLDPRYPEYAYQIIRLTDVRSDGDLSAWRTDRSVQFADVKRQP